MSGVYVGNGSGIDQVTEIYYGFGLGNKPVVEGWAGTNLGNKRFWGRKKIYSTIYPNANVYNAGIVSVNNGTRTPVTKANDGDAVVFCVKNCSSGIEGGNWMGTFSIALTAEAARLTSVGSGTGDNTTSHAINGVTYWISSQITNARWGGGTTIYSDCPIFQDWFIVEVNSSVTTAKVEELLQRLQIYPYNNVFDLFSQNGISVDFYDQGGTGTHLAFQSDGTAYGPQYGNSNTMFTIPIPARYNKIKVDIESGGRTYAYNYCNFLLFDAPGIYGYYVDNYRGNRLKFQSFIDYNTGIYSLSRQIIEVDVSNINTDMYVAFHRCDNWTRLYSIKAYL